MRFGFVLPLGAPRDTVELAREAERAGWDGVFVSDLLWGVDAWVSLGAAAMVTERVRLGTMLSPLSRMRPWKLAGETVTLDHLSGGRTILAVGLGAVDTGFAAFGEVTDRRTRAALLDEGLDILTGLWRGQPFRYHGRHYTVAPTDFPAPPPPLQQPRIPIWVAAAWPSPRSLRRALRYDGMLPMVLGDDGAARQAAPGDVRAIAAHAAAHRPPDAGPFDVVVEGETPGDDPAAAAAQVRPWADAGATWWLETRWSAPDAATVRTRIAQGPPRLA